MVLQFVHRIPDGDYDIAAFWDELLHFLYQILEHIIRKKSHYKCNKLKYFVLYLPSSKVSVERLIEGGRTG